MIGTEGEQVGSISGGCLEADVVRKMRWLVATGAHLQRYSAMFDDTSEIPYGLGCGEITLLLEPAGTSSFETLMEAIQASLRGREAIVTTQSPVAGRAFSRIMQDTVELFQISLSTM